MKKNDENKKCIPFMEALQLTTFIAGSSTAVQMTEQEADMLLRYMDSRGCMLGYRGEEIVYKDMRVKEDKQIWTAYSIDDAVNDACDCNYDMILQTEQELESTNKFEEHERINERLKSLREDEKGLDAVFDRTKYGKEIGELAEKLAEDFVRDIQSKGTDAAIQKLTEAVKEGKAPLPNASPALKKDKGAR